MSKRLVLILGGARSGKSRFAQEMASKHPRVLFVATAEPLDEEMRTRIEEHKRQRPAAWRTVEAPCRVAERLAESLDDASMVLVDCLTLLASNLMTRVEVADYGDLEVDVIGEVERLLEAMGRTSAECIVVSNEVGLGLVPDNELGRAYRDILGRANSLVASRADEVYFMVAGIPVRVK